MKLDNIDAKIWYKSDLRRLFLLCLLCGFC